MELCKLCYTSSSTQYLFTECNHLLCFECSLSKWDKRFTVKCCGQSTFCESQTCRILEMSQQKNIESQSSKIREEKRKDEIVQEKSQLHQSKIINDQSYIRALEKTQDKQNHQAQYVQRSYQKVDQLQYVLSQKVNTIKRQFQLERAQLRQRQEIAIKNVYQKYSKQLQNLSHPLTSEDVKKVDDNLDKSIRKIEMSVCNTNENYEAPKSDKILAKLEHNQQKMRQKLNRHYQMIL